MLECVKAVMWAILTVVMVFLSLRFTFLLRALQFNFVNIFRALSFKVDYGITPIKTLFLTLAGRIGVGSIAGVALAIYVGGAGCIFWMWVIALLSSILAYVETFLAVRFKDRVNNIGGPSFYLKRISVILAFCYSFLVIVAYLFGFIPIQANTIVRSLGDGVNEWFVGFLLALVTFLVVRGGISKISSFVSGLVPFMMVLYVLMTLVVLFLNFSKIPSIISLIFSSAFSFKPFISSFIPMVLTGFSRAIFSNESGIGLGGIASSASCCNDGRVSGYIQVLGVYITSIIICTATAFMILAYDYSSLSLVNPNGIELTLAAFCHHFGVCGKFLLVLCILMFSFSTILTGHYYCESSMRFLMEFNVSFIFVILTPLSVFFGSIMSSSLIWCVIDILVAILAFINLYGLFRLSSLVVDYHKNCDRI